LASNPPGAGSGQRKPLEPSFQFVAVRREPPALTPDAISPLRCRLGPKIDARVDPCPGIQPEDEEARKRACEVNPYGLLVEV